MSAQMNHTNYVASPSAFDAPERKIGDVEQLMEVLHKDTDDLIQTVDRLEQRLSSVLPPAVAGAPSQTRPDAVRVPLANQLSERCSAVAGSISRLNDIIARIDLPQ